MDANVKQEKKQDQWLKGWCAMCLQNDCGMLVRTRDGVVMEIKGAPTVRPTAANSSYAADSRRSPGITVPTGSRTRSSARTPKKGWRKTPAGWRSAGTKR